VSANKPYRMYSHFKCATRGMQYGIMHVRVAYDKVYRILHISPERKGLPTSITYFVM